MNKIILPQKVWAGRYNAQIAIKNRAITKDRRVTQFEIELPIENGGTSYIDGNSHHIHTNTVICAKPGQTRHTRLPFKCFYIHMLIHEGVIYDVLMNTPDFIEMKSTEHIRRIFERLCKCHVSQDQTNILLQQGLILELIYAIQSPAKFSKAKQNHPAVDKALGYIRENLRSGLTLADVAAEVKFAPTYFHKLFRSYTGKPLHKYVEELRIEKAADMLLGTELNLTRIAYECGFPLNLISAMLLKGIWDKPRVLTQKTLWDTMKLSNHMTHKNNKQQSKTPSENEHFLVFL